MQKFMILQLPEALTSTSSMGRYLQDLQRIKVNSPWYRWHADIKPDNILIVQGKFKLADPGFARFEKQAVGDLTTIFGGTTTYG